MLEGFQLARYRFSLVCKSEITFEEFSGATLRGAIGNILRNRAPEIYDRVYGTSPRGNENASDEDVPRPCLIDPLSPQKYHYHSGEELRFDLTLIGKAIGHLRDILSSILALEGTDDESERGLGTDQDGKGEFYLSRVLALVPDGSRYIIFDRSAGALYETAVVITEEAISRRAEEIPSERLTVHFLTPTHIKEGGEWLKNLQFHQLYRTISRRVKSLVRRYCDESVDFRRWAGPAREVETVDSTLAQASASLPRYSASQEKRQTVDGMTGTVTFEGKLDPFSLFLAAGEWVHAGKGCAVGLGKLSVGSKSHLPSIS